jgi:D-beta-D-heptose 7-phosphate kinase/D-beta-D-heptose 1-phosphate adenosyltransferase
MKKIFVNGTFDILHIGHLSMLEYARSLGTELTVAIDSDERVKLLKGSARPVNSQQERAALLASLKTVDNVFIFDTDEELTHLISEHDVMVKGSDYKNKPIVGQEVCKEIVFFNYVDGYSTTKKIENIISRG